MAALLIKEPNIVAMEYIFENELLNLNIRVRKSLKYILLVRGGF